MAKSRFVGSVGCLSLLFATLLQPLAAQTGAGTIQGTVKDSSGAAIPGAKIRLVQTATSETRETTANDTGFYTFPQAPIGAYRITVQSSGMTTWTAPAQVLTG